MYEKGLCHSLLANYRVERMLRDLLTGDVVENELLLL